MKGTQFFFFNNIFFKVFAPLPQNHAPNSWVLASEGHSVLWPLLTSTSQSEQEFPSPAS